jgi:hypothetical protein
MTDQKSQTKLLCFMFIDLNRLAGCDSDVEI